MLTQTQYERMKKEAKAMRKSDGVPLHRALEMVAQKAGFNHWQHLAEVFKGQQSRRQELRD